MSADSIRKRLMEIADSEVERMMLGTSKIVPRPGGILGVAATTAPTSALSIDTLRETYDMIAKTFAVPTHLIHTSPLLAPRTVPVRVPKTDNARIRKKWLKKYGTKQVEWFYITGHRDVWMHPETAVRLDIELSANKGHL